MKKDKMKKGDVILNFTHLEKMKDMTKKMIESYIELNVFQCSLLEDLKDINATQDSIFKCKKALERIDSIENVETINMVVHQIVGIKLWSEMCFALARFSAGFCDETIYEIDKEATKHKVEKRA